MNIISLIKKFLNKKDRYFIEYKVKRKIYNFIIKAESEVEVELKFDEIWTDSISGVYPYPEYKVISIKKVNSKIEL